MLKRGAGEAVKFSGWGLFYIQLGDLRLIPGCPGSVQPSIVKETERNEGRSADAAIAFCVSGGL